MSDRELSLVKILDAPRPLVWRCWTEPELLRRWFAPQPQTVPRAELDLRPGGSSLIVMRGPNGTEFPNAGVYLEIVPERRLVFTDAYVRAWEPSPKPFMTAILDFEDAEGGRTRYTARVQHWTAEDCQRHAEMGFTEGWSRCADQLVEVARTLS